MNDDSIYVTSLTGVNHRVTNDGVYTNGIYRPFRVPINSTISKLSTSSSGCFISLIVNNKLFLIQIEVSNLVVQQVSPEIDFFDSIFTTEESFLICLSNNNYIYIYKVLPFAFIQKFYLSCTNKFIEFNYYDLTKCVFLKDEENNCFYYKIPDVIVENSNDNIWLEKRPFKQERGSFDGIKQNFNPKRENHFYLNPCQNVYEYSCYINSKCKDYIKRRNYLNYRRQQLYANILECKRKNEECMLLKQRLNQKSQSLANRLILLTCKLDSYDIFVNERKRFKKYKSKVKNIKCVDDYSNEELSKTVKKFLLQRMETLSSKINPLDKQREYHI